MNSDDKKTILLVEDEVLIAMTEIMQLDKYGYTVRHVTTGEQAVETIIDNAFPIDLILMDIDLGSGIDGTTAAEQILKQKDIPVVFLSSHIEPELVEKTERITSYGYVVKNSGIVVLDASIKMALKLFEYKMKTELSENKYRILSENTQDFIYSFDLNSRHTMVNDAVCKAMNLKQNDLLGKNHIELGFPKEIADEWRKVHLTVINNNETIKTETSTPMPDGSFRFYEIILTPIKNEIGIIIGVRGISRDITSRKVAEDKLEKNDKLLRNMSKLAKIGGWEFFTDTLTQTWTEETFNILEVDFNRGAPNVPQGVSFIAPEYRTVADKAIQRVIEFGEPYDEEWEVVTAKGNRKWVHSTANANRTSGKTTSVSGSFQDITERKQDEDEIRKQLAEKETLLLEVHHRVKNNIANIEGLLSLQASATENPEVKTALQASISRVQSIRILYDKLLLSNVYHDISIKSYTENLIDSLLAVFVIKSNIIIEKHVSEFSLSTKKAIAIGIIINELLTNVFKYAFKNRDKGNVSVSIEKKENTITVIIQDNGVGIDERIMENKSPGFGITIIKLLVEQLKGTYSILNENGTKSTVQFEM